MKLYFNTLYPKRGIHSSNEAKANVTKAGSMSLRTPALNSLNIDETKPFYMKLYEDLTNKALGFQVEKIAGVPKKKEQGWRIITPMCAKNSKPFCNISVRTFTQALHGVTLPASLPIKTYKDVLLGNIHYIQFGNGVEKKSEE